MYLKISNIRKNISRKAVTSQNLSWSNSPCDALDKCSQLLIFDLDRNGAQNKSQNSIFVPPAATQNPKFDSCTAIFGALAIVTEYPKKYREGNSLRREDGFREVTFIYPKLKHTEGDRCCMKS